MPIRRPVNIQTMDRYEWVNLMLSLVMVEF